MLIYLLFPATLCSADQFQCRDGSCISNSSKCNQKVDCEDASDEMNCRELIQSLGPNNYNLMQKSACFSKSSVFLIFIVKRPRTVPLTSIWEWRAWYFRSVSLPHSVTPPHGIVMEPMTAETFRMKGTAQVFSIYIDGSRIQFVLYQKRKQKIKMIK